MLGLTVCIFELCEGNYCKIYFETKKPPNPKNPSAADSQGKVQDKHRSMRVNSTITTFDFSLKKIHIYLSKICLKIYVEHRACDPSAMVPFREISLNTLPLTDIFYRSYLVTSLGIEETFLSSEVIRAKFQVSTPIQ